MLEIKLIRENPEIVKKDLQKRKEPEKLKWLEDLIKIDKESLKLKKDIDNLRHSRNTISQKINQLKKQGKSADSEIKQAKEIPTKLESLENKQKQLQEKIHYYLMRLPNISHSSVPYGKDENENKIVRKWGKLPKFNFNLKSHGEIIESLYPKSFKKGAEVSGRGFYYLIDKIALLDRALVNFAIDFMLKKKYELMYHPYVLNKKAYEGATDVNKFKDTLYKIEHEDLYLNATAEHPLEAFFSNTTFKEKELPKKVVGFAVSFRKEIGSHGIDERGLHRVHQFNKVEQFIVCKPEDSWKIHEELLKNAEELIKKLKLPYRIVNACTGDLPTTTAKMYDIEVYMPREKKYKEVGSTSNCTSYQAVRSNIKYISKKGKDYVHTLNSTAIATSRVLRAILENYQTKEGYIKVPTVLQKYMHGLKVIK
ncbi:MAG: serine--tRNA ligase [Nanoarchaeota archaeon]|nr:serine--tRNA ligase [Nanoarchaeota archaeon]